MRDYEVMKENNNTKETLRDGVDAWIRTNKHNEMGRRCNAEKQSFKWKPLGGVFFIEFSLFSGASSSAAAIIENALAD